MWNVTLNSEHGQTQGSGRHTGRADTGVGQTQGSGRHTGLPLLEIWNLEPGILFYPMLLLIFQPVTFEVDEQLERIAENERIFPQFIADGR